MHRYEVTLRDPSTGDRRSLTFKADDFGHAQEQAQDYLEGDEIIDIQRDYTSKWYIHKHETALAYGGPEEGGWWYDTGVPVEDWEVLSFTSEDAAYEVCRQLNDEEDTRREEEEQHKYTDVLSGQSTFYSYSVEEYPVPQPYPMVRPHYE